MKMQQQNRQHGFTMIEIGVVVFAIAMLMSFIVPQILGFKDAATLEASSKSMQNWAKVAQSTGMNIAEFEPCEEGDGCSFRKYVDGSLCPGQVGGGQHYYDDGACVYDLSTKGNRDMFTGLPTLSDYGNTHNGNPIYLVHDAQTVQAFTCVDLAFVEGTSANWTEVAQDSVYVDRCTNGTVALYHSMPALTANYAKAIARKMSMEGAGVGGGDGDDGDDDDGDDDDDDGGGGKSGTSESKN